MKYDNSEQSKMFFELSRLCINLKQFDVKTAFIYDKLRVEIYMRQSKVFEDSLEKVFKLKRSLYGFKKFLLAVNMVKSLYSGHLHIDDGLIAATDENDFENLICYLKRGQSF